MPRIKLDLPDTFLFSTTIPVRITDLNYGNHLGNDALLGIIHEARMQFLNYFGYKSELDVAGTSLIMSDSAIVYKGEGFYGDVLLIEIAAGDLHKYGFDLLYRITTLTGKEIAHSKTGMLCFNYQNRKIALMPEVLKQQFETKTS